MNRWMVETNWALGIPLLFGQGFPSKGPRLVVSEYDGNGDDEMIQYIYERLVIEYIMSFL